MTIGKAILISSASVDAITEWVAGLGLPRRACSLPVGSSAVDSMASFVEIWGSTDPLRETVASCPFPVRAWLVAEHVPIAYDKTWPSGAPSPGVRMISTIHRRVGLSRADFKAYWQGPHTKIAKSYTVPVWHYNQNVVIECLTPDSDSDHDIDMDGFVGMHFRSAEEMRARWQDYPREAERGARDAAEFMEVARSVSITAIETVWENATKSTRTGS